MRKAAFLFGLFVLIAFPVRADWDPTQSFKWLQVPDLSPTGMDVNVSRRLGVVPLVLADDFLCTQTGLITDVHLWGSWKHDFLPKVPLPDGLYRDDPNAVMFRLSIHADIPANPTIPGSYSTPLNPPLWEHVFQPGQFTSRPIAKDLQEGWYDPVTKEYEPLGDTVCWQYNFLIPPDFAFMQKGTPDQPIVYWLDVEATVLGVDQIAEFGWKTSLKHWNDDAVWASPNTSGVPWSELRYPERHPLVGKSIDMAFVITPEPGTLIMLLGFGSFIFLVWLRRGSRS